VHLQLGSGDAVVLIGKHLISRRIVPGPSARQLPDQSCCKKGPNSLRSVGYFISSVAWWADYVAVERLHHNVL
jgi:hypothetical protein